MGLGLWVVGGGGGGAGARAKRRGKRRRAKQRATHFRSTRQFTTVFITASVASRSAASSTPFAMSSICVLANTMYTRPSASARTVFISKLTEPSATFSADSTRGSVKASSGAAPRP